MAWYGENQVVPYACRVARAMGMAFNKIPSTGRDLELISWGG